jgi:UDP-glucose 4-epimerase
LQDKEYNSNNTRRLDVEQLKELLLTLPYVQNELETH